MKKSTPFTSTFRYKLGLFLIISGHIFLALVAILPMIGLGSITISGICLVLGEALVLSSIVALGKEGFNTLKQKGLAFIKQSYTAPVGKFRHYLGICLLFMNMVTTYTIVFYAWVAFSRASQEDPMPDIWGLHFEQQGTMVIVLFIIGEFSILVSIYLLGADWWERFRRIIVWEPTGKIQKGRKE